jgi:hypothetical protein
MCIKINKINLDLNHTINVRHYKLRYKILLLLLLLLFVRTNLKLFYT